MASPVATGLTWSVPIGVGWVCIWWLNPVCIFATDERDKNSTNLAPSNPATPFTPPQESDAMSQNYWHSCSVP
ncbi:hypothetical protein BKA93DRAFT_769529 [Sparassis latifolia]